jgi:translin
VSSLKAILSRIRKELAEKDEIRENVQNDMRRALSLSKQSILLIHQKKMKEAKNRLAEAREIVSKLNELSAEHPNIVYGGMFSATLQEFSEANIFLCLVEEERFVKPEEISVPSADYVLGLADVIGEFRRLALDALREDNVKKGEECLETMDEVYVELMALDEAYMLVPGLRRKCDVARKIIEITRGDITQEVRRSALEKYLRRIEKQTKKK